MEPAQRFLDLRSGVRIIKDLGFLTLLAAVLFASSSRSLALAFRARRFLRQRQRATAPFGIVLPKERQLVRFRFQTNGECRDKIVFRYGPAFQFGGVP